MQILTMTKGLKNLNLSAVNERGQHMNEIRIFEKAEFGTIRTMEINGEPWFVGKDIADILEYTNTAKAIRDHVDDEDKLTERIVLSGQNREAILINESGLYSLILSSKMSNAKKFKRWVTSEVLPSIRKMTTKLETITFKGNIAGLVFSKNGIPITTSRKIAEVTGKDHRHILRDIRDELDKLQKIHCPNLDSDIQLIINDFKEVDYLASNGQTYKEYDLGEMATMQLMLKYSTEYRARFIISFAKMKQAIMDMFKARVVESVLPQDSRSRQFVYVIRNPENDRVKVGVSNNVEKRLHVLETGAGTKLDLVYKSIVCSNAFDIENMVHKHFNECRVFGEWFQVNASKVINFLEQQQYVLKSEFVKYVSVMGKER